MVNEGIKLALVLVAVAAVLITLAFAMRSIQAWQYNSQSQLTGSFVDSEDQPSQTTNIRRAEQTPTSCTPTQNCGRPTCAAARGGSCGCGR